MNIINSFEGKYAFLSNFYERSVIYDGIDYGNSEAAFQAQKTEHKCDRIAFAYDCPPNIAKRMGRHVQLRKDWESIKEQEMYNIVKAKFTQNPDLAAALLDTGDALLIEGNTWGDNVWGMVKKNDGNYYGANKLGKILMKVREELKINK